MRPILMEVKMTAFSSIKTRNALADYLNIPPAKMSYILFKRGVDTYYKQFDIPKKSEIPDTYVRPQAI